MPKIQWKGAAYILRESGTASISIADFILTTIQDYSKTV